VTEHKIVRGTASPEAMESMLNEAAEEGWELVAMPLIERPNVWRPHEDPYVFVFVLRRTNVNRQL